MQARVILATTLAYVAFWTTSVSAQGLADRILEYFPGKWRVSAADGMAIGEVEWKLVAGGKAAAGAGSMQGTASFSMAGWDAKDKKWIHDWYEGNGTHGHLEVASFENGTYHGELRVADGDGKVITGAWKNKIIDRDHFELTEPTADGPKVTRWTRVKN